jgi:hypothetical protein
MKNRGVAEVNGEIVSNWLFTLSIVATLCFSVRFRALENLAILPLLLDSLEHGISTDHKLSPQILSAFANLSNWSHRLP